MAGEIGFFLHLSGLLNPLGFHRDWEKGVNFSSLQIYWCADELWKLPTIMQCHCSCKAGYVDKMKYLSCKLSITFGNHITIKMIKTERMNV